MINLQWYSKFDGEVKTLNLLENPIYHGLGIYEDTDGILWDVKGVFGNIDGKPLINARQVKGSYYSTGTDHEPYGLHVWTPYRFNVVNKEENKMTKLEEKRKELGDLEEYNRRYGSELSPSSLIEKEDELRNEIKLLEMRDAIIKKWEASGILDNLRSSDDNGENLNVV